MILNATWTTAALFGGLWLVVLLINLIGGRIIPGFTRNWLGRQIMEQKRPPLSLSARAPPRARVAGGTRARRAPQRAGRCGAGRDRA